MNEHPTAESIYSKYVDKKIGTTHALKLFESLISKSDDEEIRVSVLNYISKLSDDDELAFNIIENCLISDESPRVKFGAAKALIYSLPERVLKPLLWTIQNENSIYFLKNVVDLLETRKYLQFEQIRDVIYKKITTKYKLKASDSKLILDIEYLDLMKFRADYDNFLEKFDLPDAEKQTLIKENTEIGNKGLGRVKKAEKGFIVSLILSDLNEIPSSLCNLRNLQELEISNCRIEKYPEKCPNLLSLKRLIFKNNTVEKVPSWVLDSKVKKP
ncbi:MAG: hypothetical protein KGD67_04370 [Candidatus Lokiarchaeota archaeon]|nr:hypothetical protein [Candidatus Lokiarchaeota archaeon]